MNSRYFTNGLTKEKSSSYPGVPLRLPPMATSIQASYPSLLTNELAVRVNDFPKAKPKTCQHNDDEELKIFLHFLEPARTATVTDYRPAASAICYWLTGRV